MQRTETNDPSPHSGEDRLRLPASWRKHVLPWRGRDNANSADLDLDVDPGGPEAVARRIEEFRPLIEQAMAKGARGSIHLTAVKDHLAGRPNPCGAAALMQLTESSDYHAIDPAGRRRHFDAWLSDHGLAFASVATLEAAMIHGYRLKESPYLSWPVSVNADWDQPRSWKDAQPAVHRIRSHLAVASESEYREVVAAVDAHRTDPKRCVGAALLMPTEAAWAEQAVEALSGYFTKRNGDDWMRWSFVAEPERLARHERLHVEDVDIRSLAPLIAGVGSAALPLLTRAVDSKFERLSKSARAAALTAFALLPTDEATGHLVDKLELPGALTATMEVADRFPERTLRVIAARVDDADPEARARLAGVVESSPALNAALPEADERTREAVAELVDDLVRVPEAPVDALPPLLVAPPWKTKGRKSVPVVIEGLAPSLATRVVWSDDDERRRWTTLHDDSPYRRFNARDEQRVIERFEKHSESRDATYFLSWASVEAAESILERWDGTAHRPRRHELMRILGRFGDEVADRIVDIVKGSAFVDVLVPIQSFAAARTAADWLARSNSRGPVAKRWFKRHAAVAAHLLIPDALGADERRRHAATTALRHLMVFHDAETVTTAAKDYGEAAAEAIGALIDTDPLDPLGAKIPRTPKWAAPAMLPQVLLEGRRSALPPESVGHLITVLAIDTLELPYAGVDVVAEACDPDSLARFSWKLFEQWTAAGAPSKDGWAFTQLARFADEETIRALTALIRAWPGQRQHKRAVAGLEVLGAIGSQSALRAVHGIARRARFKGIKAEAEKQIDAIADNLGLTTDQLADRLVPDFGLDDETRLVLDYGPRRFTVGFDEQLKPFVADEDGKPLKRLPKPGAKDDGELAEAAYKRFAQLKKELRTVARSQVTRLERAMVAGRTWTASEFREFFVEHPLMWHLARRLVWLAESDGEQRGFRLAEDKTVADVEDVGFDLADDAAIRLAHPVVLGDRLAAWAEVFADYEIVQPFKQLARPVMDFTEEELNSGRITRFDGATLKSGSVVGMAAHWGWQRPASDGLWVEPGVHYPLPGGGFVVVSLDPGVESYLGRVDSSKIQTVRAVHLSATADYAALGEGRDHPTNIDALTAAEVLGALAAITESA